MSSILTAPTKLMKSIKCAYTGESANVKILVMNGVSLYFSEDAYSPSRPDTMENHLKSLMQRDGVSGMIDQPECFICPYTGVAMKPVQVSGGKVIFGGGYNPCVPLPKAKFVEAMFMRGGVPDPNAPKVSDSVSLNFIDPDKAPEDVGLGDVATTADLARAEAESIMHQPKTTVTVPGRKKQAAPKAAKGNL